MEKRRVLVGEKVRLTNRITASLKAYFPQVLDWFEDKDTLVFCEFVACYPRLKLAQEASEKELRLFFKLHNVVRESAIYRRLEQIKATVPLTEDEAIIEPMQMLVDAWIKQLKILLPSIEKFEERIDELFVAQDDAELFASLPGAGDHLAPRLLVAFGNDRDRFKSAQELLCYAGIAPVKEKSGKKNCVHWRWGCPTFLRQTFVEWANQSRQFSDWANAFYKQQKQAGKSHQKAIRALAFKWIRIVFRCCQDRKPYSEEKYMESLWKKNSPLLAFLPATES